MAAQEVRYLFPFRQGSVDVLQDQESGAWTSVMEDQQLGLGWKSDPESTEAGCLRDILKRATALKEEADRAVAPVAKALDCGPGLAACKFLWGTEVEDMLQAVNLMVTAVRRANDLKADLTALRGQVEDAMRSVGS